MRLIDADELMEHIGRDKLDSREAIMEMIKNAPTIEPRRGRWTLKENVFGVAYCSECDYELHTNNTNFCPNCGADMRTEEQDD